MKASLRTIAEVLQTSEKFMESWDEESACNLTRGTKSVVEFATECFRRLCVLPGSARASEEVIFGMIGVADAAIGWSVINYLVGFHLLSEFQDGKGRPSFGMHDILMEYCENVSRFGRNPKYEMYHMKFLSYAWKHCHGEASSRFDTVIADTREELYCSGALRAFWLPDEWGKGRPWWRILSSSECVEVSEVVQYLLHNLFRHLTECGRLSEAVGLVCHMGWTKLRVTQGGIAALNGDFSLVMNAIRSQCGKDQEQNECEDALRGIMNIWSMVGKAWPVILENAEGLPTHAYGYLLDNKNKLPVVERYLASTADIVSCPWLKPKSAFWRVLDSSCNGRTFRTVEKVVDIAVGSKNIITATTNMLFWINIISMTATKEMVIRKVNGAKYKSEISAICLCDAKGIIVVGFNTGELELRNERDGNVLRKMSEAHENLVTSLAISADGLTVVSGSRDNTVRLWNTDSATPICAPLLGHEEMVHSVAISADGRTVVSGSWDSTVRLWDAEIAKPIGEPIHGCAYAADCVAISGDGRMMVSGSVDSMVRLWDVESATPIGGPLRGHEEMVHCIAMSADGRTVVSGSSDNTVRLWDTESSKPIGEPIRATEYSVEGVAISPDGRWVASISSDRTVRLWDKENLSQICEPLLGYDEVVHSVAISSDGRTVVSGSWNNTVRLWDAETATLIGGPIRGHEHSVDCVAISGDGRTVASGSVDSTIRLWDVESATAIGELLREHQSSVESVAISTDGRWMVSGSRDGTVQLWDARSAARLGEPLRGHQSSVESVAISADGRWVVSCSGTRTVWLWDMGNVTPIGKPLCEHEDSVLCVAISEDGRTIVYGSSDNTVRLWDRESAIPVGEPLRGHQSWVSCVAINADGRTVVSRSEDGNVLLWSRNASGTHWNRTFACLLPVSFGRSVLAFADADESSGVAGKLCFPLMGVVVVLELVRP